MNTSVIQAWPGRETIKADIDKCPVHYYKSPSALLLFLLPFLFSPFPPFYFYNLAGPSPVTLANFSTENVWLVVDAGLFGSLKGNPPLARVWLIFKGSPKRPS